MLCLSSMNLLSIYTFWLFIMSISFAKSASAPLVIILFVTGEDWGVGCMFVVAIYLVKYKSELRK